MTIFKIVIRARQVLIYYKCKRYLFTTPIVILLLFSATWQIRAQEFTRGIGIYPGNEKEDFSPDLHPDTINYRNLALNRPVYTSGSYDYNLTGQLITDGIIDTILPAYIISSTSQQDVLPRQEQYRFVDRHRMTSAAIDSSGGWIQFELAGSHKALSADSFALSGSVFVDERGPLGWQIEILGSTDGSNWNVLAGSVGDDYPGDSLPKLWRAWVPHNMRIFNFSLRSEKPGEYKFYRARFNAPNVINWRIAELEVYHHNELQNAGGPYDFTSAWMSGSKGEDWLSVDLGTICRFDRMVLHWIRRAKAGKIQVSDNGTEWTDIATLHPNKGVSETIKLKKHAKGRFVRILLAEPLSAVGYILSEAEIYGKGGPVAIPCNTPAVRKDLRMDMAGGNWRLQRQSITVGDGEKISLPGYNDNSWIVATIPATVLVSYLNARALPDPNFGDNQLMISESFFYSDFWYRKEFTAPVEYQGKRIFLNFDGINWKAEVYLNGEKLGRVEGGFTRGKFDVSGILIPGENNVLAVRIEKNDHPGYPKEQTWQSPDANGGQLGGDNPTYHASVGWDWIPTIRGRNTGIWNDVYFTVKGPVTLSDPFITADLPLPDTTTANLDFQVRLTNHAAEKISGILQVSIDAIEFTVPVYLDGNAEIVVSLNHETVEALRIENPHLWWPNGYGLPYLYKVNMVFTTDDDRVSDSLSFKTGIREMSFSEEGGILKIWINGRRFIGRGGNWGFPESMLRYREREYDIAVRYHKDMNFTMIRNWVGQTGDDEFFEACDRHGIMIWQDFWLANPVDGTDPYNSQLFMDNATDLVKRIRNHPSIGLYCGRNEGYPPEVLDTALRNLVATVHPGLHYISNSAWDVVSGGGPYRAMPVKYYFQERATPKFHSEMGRPNIVTYESLAEMMPDSSFWPQGRMWGIHNFCLNGAQRASSFREIMGSSFGTIDNAEEWVALAQFLNYEGYRAMFEAQSRYRMGLFLWMSHPAWPSMVWQTYDYYFEPTAAYFGCKKASEPLHIQWNPLTDSIEVVNYSQPEGENLKAQLEIINISGKLINKQEMRLTSPEDSRINSFEVIYPETLSDVYFMKLLLLQNSIVVSENFYWRGRQEGNLRALRELPPVNVEQSTESVRTGDRWNLTTTLINRGSYPAVMVRLKVIRAQNGDRILPVLYSDNYITLMPGEEKVIQIEVEHADTRNEQPVVIIEGLNVK